MGYHSWCIHDGLQALIVVLVTCLHCRCAISNTFAYVCVAGVILEPLWPVLHIPGMRSHVIFVLCRCQTQTDVSGLYVASVWRRLMCLVCTVNSVWRRLTCLVCMLPCLTQTDVSGLYVASVWRRLTCLVSMLPVSDADWLSYVQCRCCAWIVTLLLMGTLHVD